MPDIRVMRREPAKKGDVGDFWEQASCGEIYAVGAELRDRFEEQARVRYELEPFIVSFAKFGEAAGQDVLEVGVGMGADHVQWARAHPRSLAGVDLTSRAVTFTRQRLELLGLSSHVQVADAEALPFADAAFDIAYSWGVLHHSPDTPRAVDEIFRVLRPGGRARIMVYHRNSIVGYLLWLRYGLGTAHPFRSLDEIYARFLESPGTKAYTVGEARSLFRQFSDVRTTIHLSCGDTLDGAAGQRHEGRMLRLARRFWPRRLIKRFFSAHGLFLLIDAAK